MKPSATSTTVTGPVGERVQAGTGTEDAPVLDRPAPLRRLHDSGAGYKYIQTYLLAYLLTWRQNVCYHERYLLNLLPRRRDIGFGGVYLFVDPLECRDNYRATPPNMEFVHWPFSPWAVTFGTARRGLGGATAQTPRGYTK